MSLACLVLSTCHIGAASRNVPGSTQPRVWRGEVISLPTDGASDGEPTVGNGIVAVALNSRARSATTGPNRSCSLAQLYLGSNNMWEFVESRSNFTSKYFPAAVVQPTGIGNRVALGGLSISVLPCADHTADSATDFYAEERVATGQIFARRRWASGAAFELTVSIERSTGTVLTTCVWRPTR